MPMSCDTSTCRPFPAAAISAVAPVCVSDADQGPLVEATGGAHPADRVQKGTEGFVGSLQKRAHDRSLHGPTSGESGSAVAAWTVVDPAAPAAAVSDQTENVLQVVIRHRVGVSRDPYDGHPPK